MEQTTQTPQGPAGPQQTPTSPAATQPPVTPVAALTPAERKRKLATQLAIIGALCVTAPIWGIIMIMAGADSAGASSGTAKILPTILAYLPIIAPVPGIGMLIVSLVLRIQAKKLGHDASGTTPTPPTTLVPASVPAHEQPAKRPLGSSWTTPGRLFLMGVVSFILMLATINVSAKYPGNDIFSEFGNLLLWASIGCVGFSLIKAFSNDKKPPRQ